MCVCVCVYVCVYVRACVRVSHEYPCQRRQETEEGGLRDGSNGHNSYKSGGGERGVSAGTTPSPMRDDFSHTCMRVDNRVTPSEVCKGSRHLHGIGGPVVIHVPDGGPWRQHPGVVRTGLAGGG